MWRLVSEIIGGLIVMIGLPALMFFYGVAFGLVQ
tara:strand:+ start:1359 stop:1460 length:102 start_codon:yes stop_codon:yes gene_type:complete